MCLSTVWSVARHHFGACFENTCDPKDERRRLSKMTRIGFLPMPCAVKEGLSALTVPRPTATASAPARRTWPTDRDSLPVIHLDSPAIVAVRPSSELATLRVM